MRKDVLFGDEDGGYELLVKGGDFVIGNADIQNVRHIFTAHRGHYKQYPKIGIGIIDDINSTMDASLLRKIQIHLKSDGYKSQNIKIRDNAVVIKL